MKLLKEELWGEPTTLVGTSLKEQVYRPVNFPVNRQIRMRVSWQVYRQVRLPVTGQVLMQIAEENDELK